MDQTYKKVVELRELESQARTLRAKAEANLALAKTRLEQTEQEIRALGVEPDKADVELKALEAQLDKAVTELHAGIKKEIAGCSEVIRVTNEALA